MTRYERGASGGNKYVFIACLSVPPFATPHQEPGSLWGSDIDTLLSLAPHLPNGVWRRAVGDKTEFTLDSRKISLTEEKWSWLPKHK